METSMTAIRPILEKPISQLTEEDISQVTREDCRKFLKEKGMRKPSWNKWQAIQQVISLKRLLESSDDSGDGALHKIIVSPWENAGSVSVPGDNDGAYRQRDPPKSAELGCPPVADTYNRDPRSAGEANGLTGQMTIFYSGKVNVYDRVPPDKVRTIMHIAAGPIDLPRDDPFGGNTTYRSFPSHLHMGADKRGFVFSSALTSRTMQTDKMLGYSQQYQEKGNTAEGQASRKVSLQRYLEKRKDRFSKGKRATGITSSSLEMHVNHLLKTKFSNGQPSQSSSSSPPDPGVPHILCGPSGKQKSSSLSVDLNNEDMKKG